MTYNKISNIFWRVRPVFYWMALIILMAAAPVLAQDDDCPAIVQTALSETEDVCSSTARNQVCYGNIQLEAIARESAPALSFSQPGDIIDAIDVQSLHLSPLSETGKTWGIAMMKLQANLPNTLPGQNVTFVLFGDVEVTNGVEGDDSTPLQAFYFKTGLNDAPCDAAPDSGLLLQTPEGAGKVNFNVNEVEITLGSTAYLQAQPEGDMAVSVLEGEVTISAFGATVTIPAGSRATVPIDDQMRASGPPEDAEPYDPSELAALPIGLLERAITLETTPEATVEAGGGLIPEPGQWTWVNGAATEDGCPAGTGAFTAARFTPAPFDLPAGEFNIEVLVTAAFGARGGPPPGAVFSSPEPGTSAVDFSDPGGGKGHYEVRVISPTQMEGQMAMSTGGCSISFPFEVTRTGN
jgi:hypothetical protein